MEQGTRGAEGATLAPGVPLELVEWRVDSKPFDRGGKTVCRYVPYIDASTVARLLDEWVGPDRWSDDYVPGDIKGQYVLWCHLSIRFGDEWVTRRDVGKPSNMEGEKGCVSDAFKRAACLKFGVGRNVYELPTLWAVCRVDGKGNAWPLDGQTLPDLLKQLKALGHSVDGGRVAAAVDVDDELPVKKATPAKKAAPKKADTISDDEVNHIKSLFAALPQERRAAAKDEFLAYFQIHSPAELPASQYSEACEWIVQ